MVTWPELPFFLPAKEKWTLTCGCISADDIVVNLHAVKLQMKYCLHIAWTNILPMNSFET